MSQPSRLLSSALALWLVSPVARAHLVQTGFGGFYDGAVHLLITPENILVVLGLGLLAGLSGPSVARAGLLALPAAWLVGGLMGMQATPQAELVWPTTVSFGLIGLLVASGLRLSVVWLTALVVLLGGLHGVLDGVAFAAAGATGLALLGAVSAAFVVMTLSAALVVSSQSYWVRVAVRVAGSWIAAVGLLMLGWLARGVR